MEQDGRQGRQGRDGRYGRVGGHGRDGRSAVIVRHGGYRGLKSFAVAQLVYDVTVRFCERYVSRFSRTRDQMVQAARSGVQNIAEGSMASAASKKSEIKLTQAARASLEELKLDHEDHLRQRGLPLWAMDDPRRRSLVSARPRTLADFIGWTQGVHQSSSSSYREISANGAHALTGVACALLTRQVERLAADFERNGGFTEHLFKTRTAAKRS